MVEDIEVGFFVAAAMILLALAIHKFNPQLKIL